MGRLLALCIGLSLSCAVAAIELTPAEQAGKRLYREGVSSSDAQVMARVGSSDMLVPASVLPCAGCHGNDGRGRAEGSVRPPSLDWQRLARGQGDRQANGRSYPAYAEGSVARAVQQGLDPAGNRLDPAMPRFVLSMADQRNLTAYLKRLGEERDPGVEQDLLRVGTLLPEQGPLAEAGRVVRAVLEDGIEQLNHQGGMHGRRLQLVSLDPGPDEASAELALARLIEQERVFALLAPLAPMLDTRLGSLLEQAGVPLIGSTPRGGGGTQVFDPLPDLRDQLLSLANYGGQALKLAPGTVRVVYAGDDQAAPAQALQERLQQLGWAPLPVLAYSGEAVQGEGLFFLGRGAAFGDLSARLQAAGRTPYLFAASSQVASVITGLAPAWSERVFLAYPFVPGDWTGQGRAMITALQQRQGLDGRQGSLQVSTWCALRLFTEALRQVGRDASREQLLRALEGLHDVDTGLTPALGFGPGRRHGLAGAHVVTVLMTQPAGLQFRAVAPYRPVPDIP
ncbi:MAG: cytochrome c [Pseudomonas sp.]|jgi:ABC-type branched-subunit amino acid transport system substrate-binding protein|nr:cytochrome c [Pseudomonas sp.]